MNENYTAISDIIDRMLKTLYFALNMYFEYIFNSPSTINRIIKYYTLGSNEDDPTKKFIIFDNQIIREYSLVMKYD